MPVLGASGSTAGQQWPAAGIRALTTAFLEGVHCWHKIPWRRLPLDLLEDHDPSIETTNSRTGLPQAKQQGGSTTLSINSQSLLKLIFIELVMPSNHLVSVIPFSSCLQFFPASGSFPVNQFFTLGGQSIGASASASASVLPMNIQA